VVGLHPLDQRATGMQGDVQIGKFFEDVQKRQVAILVGLLEYAVKVAHRLVVVQYEAESDFVLAQTFSIQSQTVFVVQKLVVCLS